MIPFLFFLLFGSAHIPMWIQIFCAAIIGVFVVYLGFVMWVAMFGAPGPSMAAYKIFRALVKLFKRGKSRPRQGRGRS